MENKIGKVIFKVAKTFIIEDKQTKEKITASIRKKLKTDNTILVGDNVEYKKIDNEYVIEKIIERKNSLIRPKVANINYLFLVYSVKEPDFSSFLLNKFLAFYESRNIDNVIIYFSKIDLLNEKEKNEIIKIIDIYQSNGYIVFRSDLKEQQKQDILNLFNNNTICFAGQSGVGKSTFINFLIPDLNLKTQEISNSLNRGKHTTTSSLFIPFANGYLIDTPGFSSLELDMTKKELATSFHDFRTNHVNCKFRDCLHSKEKGCKIKELVNENIIDKTRYEDYLKMLETIRN